MTTKMEQFSAKNPNPVLSVGKDGTVIYSNEASEPLLHEWGVKVGEKLPSNIGDIVQRALSLNSPEKIEVKVGNRLYLLAFHPLSEDECVNIYGSDITDYKEIEEHLREAHEHIQIQSEELQVSNEELRVQSDELNEANALLHDSVTGFRTLAENSPDLIARFDRQGHCLYANPAAKFYDIPVIAEFYGWSVNEFVDKTNPKLSVNPVFAKSLEKQRKKVFTTGKHEAMELHYISSQGKNYYFDTKIVPEFVNGEVISTLVISRDITKKKDDEEILAKIEISHKKEIHHRIKNNLQVISSLLDLQADKFKNMDNIRDSEVLEAFRESKDRVISMALIHEELHKGKGFEKLNFSSYIEKLAENLLLTYRLGNSDIDLNMNISENILLDTDTAVPLGIIINELVSNSLKYAFPVKKNGEIRIELRKEEGSNTSFMLIVSDNGIGIPEELDIEELDSLGLQLVNSLVDQLDGELEMKRNNGTEFVIRFLVKGYDDQTLLQPNCN